MKTRLTIVIPTFNRPGMLPRALDSALAQTVPVLVVIADDGDGRTGEMLRARYPGPLESGEVRHVRTGATNAWDNWRAGMEAAGTEFVAWLQDDDVVSRRYGARILAGFDGAAAKGARPDVWLGRLNCSVATPLGDFGLWYASNGPWVPMRDLYGEDEPTHFARGKALAASSYMLSWALSPGIAYRNGPRLRAALAAMPPGCDIFVERIIPAEMAAEGGFVADPAIVGHWIQHDDHLSRKQWADQPRQTRLLVAHLDGLLDRLDGWQAEFRSWCGTVPPLILLGWIKQLDHCESEGGKSRHGGEIRRLMVDAMKGRIKTGPVHRWWRRAINEAAGWVRRRAAL